MAENSMLPPLLFERMRPFIESGRLKLPPPVFKEMGGEILDINLEDKSLVARFPVEVRFQNAMGYVQGGIIAAAIDNAIGPLSLMVAPPAVTRELTVRYLRPIGPT